MKPTSLLYAVRSCTTTMDTFQGKLSAKVSLNPALSHTGLSCARQLYLELGHRQLDTVYTSPCRRAYQTAQELARGPDTLIQFQNILRPWDWNPLEAADKAQQLKQWLHRIDLQHRCQRVVAITHHGMLQLLFHVICRQSLESAQEMEFSRGSFAIFRAIDGLWRLESLITPEDLQRDQLAAAG